ncbi:hypothetical protein NXS98_06840 [Fontisphaera persica]|uniref:hypothetical protein n=1 Tax=Fontisphaera persica TaxID=2974023 RepID=UPI0024BFC3E5|nr:hypothetical protein [Fontisphaera persica]WCJ60840.1 hypothetical protein NXS98_06840 [Fontisphaera persica]
MRRFWTWLLMLLVAAAPLAAAELMRFKLTDGSTLEGEIGKFSFTKDGLMVRLPNGKYSPRVRWTNVSKESLQQLAENKDALPFIEALLEPPEELRFEAEEKAREVARTIKINPVPNRPERPAPPSKFAALFLSPVTLVLVLLIWAGSLYASYEIAIFKNRPVALVMPIAAFFPVVGPLVFFCLPPAPVKSAEELEAEAAAAAALQEGEVPVENTEGVAAETVATVEETAPAQPQYPPPQVFKRGQFIFNRRFFETKFAPFFRPVLGEEEKDMVIIIRSARGEYIGHRFSKAEPNHVFLQIYKGNASEEVMLPFVEINEVIIKHKDAPMP